jgi:hypothetical protein
LNRYTCVQSVRPTASQILRFSSASVGKRSASVARPHEERIELGNSPTIHTSMRVRCLGIILTLASAAAAYAPVLSRVGRPRVIMMSSGEDEVRRASAAANNASAAGLAASGAGISTIAATAAGVCAGGACAVGAGAGAPAAAAAVGGFNAWIAGGLVAAATFLGMPTGVPTPTSSVVEYRTGGVD